MRCGIRPILILNKKGSDFLLTGTFIIASELGVKYVSISSPFNYIKMHKIVVVHHSIYYTHAVVGVDRSDCLMTLLNSYPARDYRIIYDGMADK